MDVVSSVFAAAVDVTGMSSSTAASADVADVDVDAADGDVDVAVEGVSSMSAAGHGCININISYISRSSSRG